MATTNGSDGLDRVFREEHGRVVASLTRRLGDIDVAEEAAQEAYLIALQRWPEAGMPPNPGAWLTTTAYNRAIDRIRRESSRDAGSFALKDESDDPQKWVTLAEMEAEYVAKVLRHTGNNKQAASRLLNIDRKTLTRIANRTGSGPDNS